jgi:hypothetical protein
VTHRPWCLLSNDTTFCLRPWNNFVTLLLLLWWQTKKLADTGRIVCLFVCFHASRRDACPIYFLDPLPDCIVSTRHWKDIYQRIFISYILSKNRSKGYYHIPLSFFWVGYVEGYNILFLGIYKFLYPILYPFLEKYDNFGVLLPYKMHFFC